MHAFLYTSAPRYICACVRGGWLTLKRVAWVRKVCKRLRNVGVNYRCKSVWRCVKAAGSGREFRVEEQVFETDIQTDVEDTT